jgi:predicted nucleic acid-binding protein
MRYLLDVNALVALGLAHHEFHDRVANWVQSQRPASLATCSITELGFVRVISQVSMYGLNIIQAQTLLLRLKKSPVLPIQFIADSLDISHLPTWVRTPNQTTDGHLVQLAKANDATLATLDEKIIGAFLIPERRIRSQR